MISLIFKEVLNKYEDPRSFFGNRKIHLKPKGHRLLAETLYERAEPERGAKE